MKNIFKKNETVQLYRVTFKEVDTDEVCTQVMDAKCANGLCIDWAFEVLKVEKI